MLVEEINPTDYVVDYTYTLGADQVLELSKKLGDLEKQTGYQVSVIMINSLEGDYIEHFAVKLYEKLKIGNAKKDEGALLIIAKSDRQMRIEVGYGLEPILTDGVTKDILDNFVKPEFKQEKYYEGVSAGVNKISEVLTVGLPGETLVESGGNFNWFDIIIFIFVFGINILGWLFAIMARTKSWWLGGVATFVIGLPILYFGFGLNVFGNIILFFLTLTGFIFDYFISRNYKYWQSKMPMNTNGAWGENNSPAWWAGGTWGPGSGPWTGSSGGSGFGGFGGGSSGGGGSSSSW